MDECRGSAQTTAEIHGGDDGLHRVGQDRSLVAPAVAFLTPSQEDVVAQTERAGHVGQGPHVDDGCFQLAELAVGVVWVLDKETVGNHQTQDRVAEELKALVVGHPAVLVGVGPVCQGTQKQRLVNLLVDQLEEVVGQKAHGPLRRPGPGRGLRDTHAWVRPDQLWCSLRSATP